jgi:hypothetical protein
MLRLSRRLCIIRLLADATSFIILFQSPESEMRRGMDFGVKGNVTYYSQSQSEMPSQQASAYVHRDSYRTSRGKLGSC